MVDYLRQLDIFDPAKHQRTVTIVGAGGIGGPTALALAKLGVECIKVYDFDTVEAHNQPNQMYGEQHIDIPKVHALRSIVNQLADKYPLIYQTRVNPRTRFNTDVVISAVDSMAAREAVAMAAWSSTRCQLLLDGRIGGEVLRLLSVRPHQPANWRRYSKTIVHDDHAAPLRCTAAGVIDVSFAIASMITRAFRLWATTGKIERDIILDQRNLQVFRR